MTGARALPPQRAVAGGVPYPPCPAGPTYRERGGG